MSDEALKVSLEALRNHYQGEGMPRLPWELLQAKISSMLGKKIEQDIEGRFEMLSTKELQRLGEIAGEMVVVPTPQDSKLKGKR